MTGYGGGSQPGVSGGSDSQPGEGWFEGPCALTGPAVSVRIAGTDAIAAAITRRRRTSATVRAGTFVSA